MNAIAVNLLTGAVSEYTNFAFTSVSPRYAGSATGLFALGGNLDVAALIVSTVETGKLGWGDTLKSRISAVYFGIEITGTFHTKVNGVTSSYTYLTDAGPKGVSRGVPGRGIRENFISFGMSTPSGQAFVLTSIEVGTIDSTTRRI